MARNDEDPPQRDRAPRKDVSDRVSSLWCPNNKRDAPWCPTLISRLPVSESMKFLHKIVHFLRDNIFLYIITIVELYNQ